MKKIIYILILVIIITNLSCGKETTSTNEANPFKAINATFGANLDPTNLSDYANQFIPTYITKDNTNGNTITNSKASLGRVLFYDTRLSVNDSFSCASCHIQNFAFGDTAADASDGVFGGLTGRHSMRLINARFAQENKVFWDERATSIENQSTQPFKDHNEQGFSGQNGRPNFDSLLRKIANIDYYKELFLFIYNDNNVTETRLQECLAQFVRSIQSFDSKFDSGLSSANNLMSNFSNFTAQENMGKNLFLTPPTFDANSSRIGGGLGCNACHRAPEFDIDPNSLNNGIVGIIGKPGLDLTNTLAPSLRDLVNSSGTPNTPMMHTGILKTLMQTIGHYGTINIAAGNTNLDNRLKPNGIGQKLNLNNIEVNAVMAFIKTLTGKNVYTDKKYSNPFLQK